MGDQFTLRPPAEREEGAWVPIPDQSLLMARVVKAYKKKMPFTDRDTGEDVYRTIFEFQVTSEGAFKGRKVEGMAGVEFAAHEKCRLYQWVKALFNETPPIGFQLDTDDLEGLPCEVIVKADEKERRDGKGTWINNNVIDVRTPENAPVTVGSVSGGIDYNEEPF